eukprot:CAMPEP_0119026148 /NCGR_PEP_ID=MMETSP1176-20130426/34971_1 /TAXON_ID=265551 /ORGANISM="Synedropsis recta cf, Strain CCMP1620" /LENGTH=105 /DNA_ID=CAMNT_0006981815 /DNA_START=157 /DNA_END=471 /DNA_ORIENTATION=-
MTKIDVNSLAEIAQEAPLIHLPLIEARLLCPISLIGNRNFLFIFPLEEKGRFIELVVQNCHIGFNQRVKILESIGSVVEEVGPVIVCYGMKVNINANALNAPLAV